MTCDTKGVVKATPFSLSAALTKEFITPDTLLYHGTTGTFDKFDLKAPRNGTTPEDEVDAVFFSTDRFKAWTHAKRKARATGEDPRIITAKVAFKNLFDATELVKKLQKKLKNFGQAKRQIYNQVDKTKYDGIEFRGDNVNDPEFCFFRPGQIKVIEDKKMEASERKLGKSLAEQGRSVVVMYRAVATTVTEFFDRDYVTLSKKFAIEHAEHNAVVQSEQQHVIKKIVSGKYVFDAYNPGEYFYSGPVVRGKVIYKTDNEMEAAERKTTVIKNPTAAQVKRLLKGEPYHEIKGWVHGNDVYFWNNVEDWHHANQAETLGVPKDKIHTRENNLNKLVIMPVAEGGYNKESGKYALVHYGWDDSNDKIKGLRLFFGNSYLRGLIKDLDLYIDDPDSERSGNDDHDLVNYIKGIDYMKKIMIAADFNELHCWITSDGTQLDVTGTDDTHAGTFRRLCTTDSTLEARFDAKFHSKSTYNIYSFCTNDLGWIRVSGHGKYFSAMIAKDKVSPRAVSKLSKMLKNEYEYSEFILDYYENIDSRNYKDFYQLSDLISEMRKNISKELVASYAGTGEYGYWLHDGKVGEVEHEKHELYVRKHFSGQKPTQAYDHAFSQGWIRAVNERDGNLSIELWYDYVTRASLKALSYLINTQNTYKGFIVEIRRGHGNAILPENLRERYFTFKEGEERKVLHLVRQCLKEDDMTAMDEQYGYWFTANGERLDVEEMRHNYVAQKYIESHKDLEDQFNAFKSTDFYGDIYKNFALNILGWIRATVTDDRLDIEIAPRKVSPKAFKAFRQYVDRESVAEEFLLDIINTNSRFLNRDRKQTLYNDIQKQVDKSMTANDDDYGYWITNKGALIKVNFEDHNGEADKYIHKHFYTEYLEWVQENDTMDSTEFLLTKGFIRLVAEGQILNVEIDKSGITKEAYKALSKFYNDHYFDRINIDVGFQRSTTTAKHFGAATNDLNKFLPFVRTYASKTMEAAINYDVQDKWWITNTGKVIKLDTSEDKDYHFKHLVDNYEAQFGSINPVQAALKAGWVRINHSVSDRFSAFSINVGPGVELSNDTVNSVMKVLRANNFDTEVLIEALVDDDSTAAGISRRTQKFKPEQTAAIRAFLKKNTLTAASKFYGAWITDKGKVIEVDHYDHAATFMIYKSHSKELDEQFKAAYPKDHRTNDIYSFALGLGWLRIVSSSSVFRIEFKDDSITRQAFNTLVKYIKDYGEFDLFIFDKMAKDGTSDKGGQFYDLSHLLAFLRKNIRKDKTLEATDSVYGYWITSEGKLLKVPTDEIGHASILKKYAAKEFTEQQWERIHNADYWSVLGKGWIRLAVEGYNNLNVEIVEGCVSREAYKKLVVLLKSNRYNMFLIDINTSPGLQSNEYADYEKAGQLLSKVEQNIRKEKTIVAIDGDNNVTGRYSQIAIEQWQPDNSTDRIQLLNIGQDFVIRTITGSDSNDLTPFKFIETARKALFDLVRDMEHAGIIYKKQAIQPFEIHSNSLEAADEETVIKRWETGGGKHAITLVQDKYGYSINNFVLLPNGEYKKDGSSFLGKADLEQALKKISDQLALYKNVDGTGFREVRVSKVLENLVPKKEAQKTAQVTVRGKIQDQLDGFKKFSKQPEVPGLSVYVKKVGSFQYAKVIHDQSKLALVSLTKKPLSFSPSELVERINVSPLKDYNWLLPQDQLFKKYGPSVLVKAAQDFTHSLDVKMMDKTDQALQAGLKNWVKDYIIALYLKRPDAAKNIMKQIDKDIKDKGLNKEKVYFYYGNPSIKSDEVWNKVGLVRIGTAAPYKYEFADKVQNVPPPTPIPSNLSPVKQAIVLINQGYPLDAAVKQVAKNKGELDSLRRDVKLEMQRSSRVKQETGDKLTQKQGNYTWATVAGRARKSEFSFEYKGTTIGSILVPDANLVKTLQSFGNDKVNPEYFDSPYLKKLTLQRSPNYGINLSYNLYSDKKKVGIIYSPTPEVFGIIKRINAVADTEPVKTEKKSAPKTEKKTGMVGSYVTGTDRFGDKVAGILLTEKRNPKTYKSEGTAVIIDDDGAPVKVKLTGVRRKLTKAPSNLTKAYKIMTANLRLEANTRKYYNKKLVFRSDKLATEIENLARNRDGAKLKRRNNELIFYDKMTFDHITYHYKSKIDKNHCSIVNIF